MASLTKIMTCIVAIEFYQKNNIDPKKLKLKITQKASKI
jgi:D-alanyl-D-alanine carboxypeptidase